MTMQEVTQAVINDDDELRRSVDNFSKKFGSVVKKSNRFPVVRTYEAVLPTSRNRYQVVMKAMRRTEWKNPDIGCYTTFLRQEGYFAAFVMALGNVVSVKACSFPSSQTRSMKLVPFIFTSHFFERYRERVLGDPGLPPLETISLFFRKNGTFAASPMSKEFSRTFENYRTEGQETLAISFDDGYAFAETIPGSRGAMLLKTMITKEMLGNTQIPAYRELDFVRNLFI